MRIWTSEHIFQHPWETVVQAAWKKYPNPINLAVVAIDVVDREITEGERKSKVLKTHRLISSKWGLPSWARPLLGSDNTCYASEHSEVDPENKTMTLMTKNLTFYKQVSVVEKLKYSRHPMNQECTLLRHEAVITIKNVPLSNFIEDYLAKSISSNAIKGRQAMEWVINKINSEVQELTNKTVKSMDEITITARKSMSAKKGINLNHLTEDTLPNFQFDN